MFWRAAIAFLALPGTVAYFAPLAWLLVTNRAILVHPLGLVCLVGGTLGLLWCVRDFFVQGRGTLAPWAPPESLVAVGLYRFTRNPMYLSVLSVLIGWALAFASLHLAAYAVLVGLGFHFRVLYGEEPWLQEHFGTTWSSYASQVPRWLGPRNEA